MKELENELLKTFRQAGTESDIVTGSMLEFPYVKTSYQLVGDDRATRVKAKQIEKTIKERRQQALNHRLAIESYINRIRDSEIRLIISLKYIKGLTWLEVSNHIYGYPSETRAYMKLKRYLEK